MYHRSLSKNKSWYLVIGLWVLTLCLVFILLLMVYQVDKGHYEENKKIHRELSISQLRDSFAEDQVLFLRLKKIFQQQDKFERDFLGDHNLLSKSIKQLNQERGLSEKIRSIFYFNPNTLESLWFSREGKILKNLSSIPLESLIKDVSIFDEFEQEKILRSSFFSYSLKKNDLPSKGVLFVKRLQGDIKSLGFYGFLVDVESWQNQILDFGEKAVIIEDNFSVILGDKDLSYFLGSLKDEEILSTGFLLKNAHFRMAKDKIFFSYLIEDLSGKHWYLIQEKNLSLIDYFKDIVPSLVILLIIVFFLSFLICYVFLERYVGRPINALSDHIINICYEHNLFRELPEFSIKDEVGYLVKQFFYFQKRMGTMLLEIKNFHMQNSSIQEAIYNRSGNLYENSQDLLVKSTSVVQNSQTLELNMKNFIKESSLLFELFEGMAFSLKDGIKSKENIMTSWQNLIFFLKKNSSRESDNEINLSQESDYKIIGLYHDTNEEFLSLQSQVKESYELLEKFNENRMKFLDAFFAFKETLTFLTHLSEDSSESLNHIYREIEELFLLQSQDLKKSREKISSLLEKV